MSLNPLMVNPCALDGSVAVPPGMVASYAALCATEFGTTACTVTSWGCMIVVVPKRVAMHWVSAQRIGSPLVVTAPADRIPTNDAVPTIEPISSAEPTARRRRRVPKRRR